MGLTSENVAAEFGISREAQVYRPTPKIRAAASVRGWRWR